MIKEPAVENLLAIADAYAAATGLTLGTISARFYGNNTFLRGLRLGTSSITVKQLDLIVARFSREWPKGAKWPKTAPIWMCRMGKDYCDKVLGA